jgi:DNA-binding transcriptional regulator YiaG
VEWNSESVQQLINAAGFTRAELARRVGISGRGVTHWLEGNNKPSEKYHRKLGILWKKYVEKAEVPEEASAQPTQLELTDIRDMPEWPLSPAEFLRLRTAMGLKRGTLAKRIGVHPTQYTAWEAGHTAPTPRSKYAGTVLHLWREYVLGDAQPVDGTDKVIDRALRKRSKIPVTKIQEIATRFHGMYVPEYNKRYAMDVLNVLTESTGLDKATVRLVVSSWAVLMKERFIALEEALQALTGTET